MENQLAIKVYDIDYDFIIKNYLDKSLWHKEWTLFVYKNITFTISLSQIDVKDESISFHVHIYAPEFCRYEAFWYYMQQMSIKILKQQIEGCMFRLIEAYEEGKIKDEQEYRDIRNSEWDEKDRLRTIAENFLDENSVTNDEIREVYIDNYVDQNTRVDEFLSDYIRARRYMVIPDLYIILGEITKDESRLKRVMDKLQTHTNLKEILETAEKYLNQLENQDEELIEDLKDNLEAI